MFQMSYLSIGQVQAMLKDNGNYQQCECIHQKMSEFLSILIVGQHYCHTNSISVIQRGSHYYHPLSMRSHDHPTFHHFFQELLYHSIQQSSSCTISIHTIFTLLVYSEYYKKQNVSVSNEDWLPCKRHFLGIWPTENQNNILLFHISSKNINYMCLVTKWVSVTRHFSSSLLR